MNKTNGGFYGVVFGLLLPAILICQSCAHKPLNAPSGAGVQVGIDRSSSGVREASQQNQSIQQHSQNIHSNAQAAGDKNVIIRRWFEVNDPNRQ